MYSKSRCSFWRRPLVRVGVTQLDLRKTRDSRLGTEPEVEIGQFFFDSSDEVSPLGTRSDNTHVPRAGH